ncbi:hypothetical protein SAMN05216359_105310 [Roseateles sp. YR242]|uniref:hypothetical protein n=1 Tax=Roseateles sp. YR242 TaxID=1855305 RepID=UPI0008AC17AF|nr:hypothetical protein [Roseateles sp. YR242]SEL13117.1 hypothetical protein SAMN05216359_105310 [Roseateles sp. YR242]
MDREQEEKPPGGQARGKTSGSRGVKTRMGSEEGGISEWEKAGASLSFWIGRIKTAVEKEYAAEYMAKVQELRR